MDKKLICRIDCTETPPSEDYFEVGETRIVQSAAGRYREASHTALSRFGYRVRLEDVSKPHLLEIKYPDDRRRLMCVNDGTSYDLTTGVVCGGYNKPSGRMLTIENYFWARWTDESVVFSTWGKGEPAAVCEFSIYQLDSLPSAGLESSQNTRSIGLQYEDPCNVSESEGAKDHATWTKNISDYMKFTGQNALIYPINWYHGPVIPVKCQPCERWNTYAASDRKMYWRSTLTPPDWLSELLTKFDGDGLEFTGSMTLLRLGRLMRDMNNDLEAIKNGADTYNNMLFDDNVQSSCNDWTGVFNPYIFHNIPEAFEHGGWPALAYGEHSTSSVSVPIFNPLHPTVRAQIEEYIAEVAGNYASHLSFKGISINFWHATIMWFGNLKAGYDDYSIGLFERETGINTGIPSDAHDRFSRRYKFLNGNCRPAFIAWRCEKIKEFICRIRDILRSCRSDLKLTLTVWNETSAHGYLGGVGADTQYGMRISNYEVYREGGLDLALFAREDNIELAVENNHMRDRGRDTSGEDSPPENSHMFTDFTFLDSETHEVLSSAQGSTSFIFNCWVEAWGNHKLFRCDPDDPNLEEIHRLSDYDAQLVICENSTYDDDTEHRFWFDSQLRITAAFPPEPYYMEWYINEIALHDSLSITSGGLYLDKAHATEQLRFAQAYRKLPRKKFNTLAGTGDPIMVRWLTEGGRTYIYIANREPYSVGVNISFKESSGQDRELKAQLGAFELFVHIWDDEVLPLSYTVNVPLEIAKAYEDEWSNALIRLTKAWEKGARVSGCMELAERASNAVREGRYSFVRHALKSYAVEKTLLMLNN